MSHYLHQLSTQKPALELWDGVFTIGDSETDDIIIDGVGSQRLEFVYVDERLIIQAGQGDVWVDGQACHTFPFYWQEGQVLSLGQDAHLIYTSGETLGEVAIPNLATITADKGVVEVKKNALATYLPKEIRLFLLLSVLSVGAVISLAWYATFLRDNYTVIRGDSQATIKPTMVVSEVEAYGQRVLGQQFLAMSKDGERYVFRAVEVNDETSLRWKQDLERLFEVLPQESEIELNVIPMRTLMMDIKNEVKTQLGDTAQRLTINADNLQVQVSGAVHSGMVAKVNSTIEQLGQSYPYVTFSNRVHGISGLNIEILALSVSQHNASVTVRRDQQTAIVSEGKGVFDVGTLRLIQYNGIVIMTKYGEVFVPWKA